MNQATCIQAGRVSTAKLTVMLGILTAFAPFSTDMYLAAFPAMAGDMNTEVPRIQLTLSVFFFGLALGQLAYGPLSDRFGRRRPLLAGLIIYTAASAGLIFVRDIEVFLILRFIQAIGGCAGMIISRAVIRDTFDLNSSARVLTMMMAVQSIGPVAAPVIGGYLLALTAWPSIFVLLTCLGAACFIASLFSLPESLPPENRLEQGPKEIAAGFLALFKSNAFIVPALSGGLGGAAIFAFITGSPFVLMALYGLNETQYGWAFGLFCLGTTAFSQSNFILLKKFSARQVLAGALALMSVAAAALSLVIIFQGQPSLAVLLAFLFVALLTIPIICANATAVAMAASGERAGSASSLIGMAQFTLAGLVSSVTSVIHNGTALPMAVVIAVCGLSALLVLGLGNIARR
ncbi:Bcr/CflA family drug resistance efflux transporter [Deltaproteobacteria bacterium Smac51]|nr:Bcr/CflA family drug resistance efflux transporter [Deltaproteobacteria bacterium Smac51]